MPSQKIGLYALDPFSTKDPTSQQQAEMLSTAQTIAAAGFNTVMLASMHVTPEGWIYFNDTSMIGSKGNQLGANLGACIDAMSGAGGVVLASFGGGGSIHGHAVGYWDFSHIQALIKAHPNPADNPFFQNLATMFETYPGISGIDIDLESYSGYDQFLDTLVTLVDWLSQQNKLATLCPYALEATGFWCNVVRKTTSSGKLAVAWINLQNASGTLGSYQKPLADVGIGLDLIVGGFQLDGSGPSGVQSNFAGLEKDFPGTGGGWLWNLGGIKPLTDAQKYADAIAEGLSGTSGRTKQAAKVAS